MPTAFSPLDVSFGSLKTPVTPTTAPSCSSVRVVAGSSRLTWPAWTALTTAAGRASASTLRPTFRSDPGHAHHRSQLQQCQGSRWIVEIDLASLDGTDDCRRQGVGVNLETDFPI